MIEWQRLLEPDYLAVICIVAAFACVQFSKNETVHLIGAVLVVIGIALYGYWAMHIV